MSKGFNLGEYLKGSGALSVTAAGGGDSSPGGGAKDGAGVSELNTGREELRYLPLDQIDPDPANFYSLEGLDELAASIELIGLQQPLRVRPALSVTAAGGGDSSPGGGAKAMRYIVVSGHRRRAACMMIRDGGNPMFDGGVPCLVDYGEASDAMRELRLIFANSATRVMSSAEQSKQAERVTELLYQLKEQGVEFPGRMRDHVAEACHISTSKLARLNAIRNNLEAPLLERYERGEINEDVAYRMSQESFNVQIHLAEKLGPAVRDLTKASAEAVIGQIKSGQADEEPTDSDGANQTINGLKRYLDERAKEDREFWKLMQRDTADSLILRSFSAGAAPMRKDNIDMLRTDARNSSRWTSTEHWTASNKGLAIGPGEKITRTWTEVYDAVAAIAISRWRQVLVDERNKRGRQPAADVPTVGTAEAKWQTGTPPKTGYYAARLEFYGKPIASPRVLWWDEGVWYNAVGDDIRQHKIDAQIRVVGWWPLPERD